ncbi:hypothetical protein MM221_04510 [Salipaludibacillus sp. LMS25]|uniref:hypothetical protein n=1 Tax=Salipaludibacillus sp. LMS25 TaxID=2924031 RepID=UPI0020D1B48C|nr:hypothetical protein [Salipaludibacillus sp. LMS25]UTR15830.1 hypothetical protein MM221_04510 [Salipaludibacillus sp. LMS25]
MVVQCYPLISLNILTGVQQYVDKFVKICIINPYQSNQWFQDMIDSVLPAFINTLNIGAIMTTITRAQIVSMAPTVAESYVT